MVVRKKSSVWPVEVIFGLSGNSVSFQADGWSTPEADFTWSVGPYCKLALPPPPANCDLLILISGHPFLEPGLPFQRLTVIVDAQITNTFYLHQPFSHCFRVSSGPAGRSSLVLEFRHPDARRPEHGDSRQLGICWRLLHIACVPPLRSAPAQEVDAEDFAGVLHFINTTSKVSYIPSYKEHQTALSQRIAGDPKDDGNLIVLAGFLSFLLSVKDWGYAAQIVSKMTKAPEGIISLSMTGSTDPSIIECTLNGAHVWTFGFSRAFIDRYPDDTLTMVIWHWLSVVPVFLSYDINGRLPGQFILNAGDEPHAPGIAFCGNSLYETRLIADPYFLKSGGYKRSKQTTNLIPFAKRIPAALWRGSTTGLRDGTGLLGLPRVKLCLMSGELDNNRWLNAGFTQCVQLETPDEKDILYQKELVRNHVPSNRLSEWMFLIDIDGNTNSWPGLYSKLISGSLVLKVDSLHGWRQWYYDRLEPFVNFVPILPDLSDLISKIKFFIYNVDEAQRIGEAGRMLALSMGYQSEVMRACEEIESEVVCSRNRKASLSSL